MSARITPHASDALQHGRDRGPEAVRVRFLGGFFVSVETFHRHRALDPPRQCR
jgi:hypothetical protein